MGDLFPAMENDVLLNLPDSTLTEMQSSLRLRTTPASTERSLLILTTAYSALAMRSGYTVLAEYMPGCEVISAERTAAQGFFPRSTRFALSRGAITAWYQLASASLEWRAWKRIRAGYRGVVHMLWADSDLGFLDLLLKPDRHGLCCTFHQTPDVLRQLIRYPDRLKAIRRLVLMSSNQVEYFLDRGVAEERISVIPHGVDTAYFQPIERSPAAMFTVLSVGSYRRNFQLLRDVCERLRGHRDVRFEVVTATAYHRQFNGLPNVTCRANLTDQELLTAYQSASCYLVTAEDATANNALLESMACGVPVVAEGVGGIPEYAAPAGALITAQGDARQIVEAIIALKESAALCQQMAGKSRSRALELDWSRVADRTRKVYPGTE